MSRLLSALLLALCLAVPARAGSCLREDFDSLANWTQVAPMHANRLTGYGPAEVDGRRVLEARSRNSASGLLSTTVLEVAKCRALRWVWRVENPLPDADLAARAGDDSPLRVMLLFYARPGDESPHSMLGYAWGNREAPGVVLDSPGQKRFKVKVLRAGSWDCGRWLEEAADLVADYRAAFGHAPPPYARRWVLADSDDTRGASTAYVDFIEVGP